MNEKINSYPEIELNVDQIKLDSDNPRIQKLLDDQKIKGINNLNQSNIKLSLGAKTNSYRQDLKNSIIKNGLLEAIYVYQEEDKFVVIEGNTRFLIFDELYNETKQEKWKVIKAKIIKGNPEEIDFIRLEFHLGGKKPWDPYERARYLFNLRNKYTLDDISIKSRKSLSEIQNDIQAFQVMENIFLPKYRNTDEDAVKKFSYFVELVKSQKLNRLIKINKITEDEFCEWVTSKKIPRAIDVRHIHEFFENGEDIAEEFKKNGYERALELLNEKKPSIVDPLFKSINKLIIELNNLNIDEIEEIRENEEKVKYLEILKNRLNSILGKN